MTGPTVLVLCLLCFTAGVILGRIIGWIKEGEDE